MGYSEYAYLRPKFSFLCSSIDPPRRSDYIGEGDDDEDGTGVYIEAECGE